MTSEDGPWMSVEGLFGRIPETGELFLDVFESPCLWLHPAHDGAANFGGSGPPERGGK